MPVVGMRRRARVPELNRQGAGDAKEKGKELFLLKNSLAFCLGVFRRLGG